MIDGSLTPTFFYSGGGWLWMNSNRRPKLIGMHNVIHRESILHTDRSWKHQNGLWKECCFFGLSTFWESLQRFDCDCKGTTGLAEFLNKAEGDTIIVEKISKLQ